MAGKMRGSNGLEYFQRREGNIFLIFNEN